MGLVAGVVQIDFPDYPGDVPNEFLQYVNEYVWDNGHYARDIEWSIGADGHTFIELHRNTMLAQVEKFVSERGLSPDAMAELQAWSDGLPWRNDVIMLYLTW